MSSSTGPVLSTILWRTQCVLWYLALLCHCYGPVYALPSLLERQRSQNATLFARQQNPKSLQQPSESSSSILRAQLAKPAGVIAVLLIIGGDVIQKACAQLVAGVQFPYGTESTEGSDQKSFSFTPVAFSFGWVAYAFGALMSAFGDGPLMPHPDTSCVVMTVGGQWRQNESWVIGRLVRDLELTYKRHDPRGLRIDFFESSQPGTRNENRNRNAQRSLTFLAPPKPCERR